MNEKAALIVQLAEDRLGEPYVFGAIGEACTPENRKRRARADYPSIVSRCQVLNGDVKSVKRPDGTIDPSCCNGCAWKGKQIYDCRGFTYWILKQVGITISTVGATTQYNTVKDWIQRGNIQNMPNLVCCVFKYRDGKMQHTGLHVGDGNIIHCSTIVKRGKTTDSGWTHYAIPKGLYSEEELTAAGIAAESAAITAEIIKKGCKGESVKQLQNKLLSLGYTLPRYGADGSFGAETESAVKQFQHDNGLNEDGIVGPLTTNALADALTEKEVDPVLYTLTIPGLNEAQMQALIAQYPTALVTKTA